MSLKTKIINEIKANGEMNIARYMELCLNEYYQKEIIFGENGDFITAPEICQTFGEMLALWIIGYWQQLNMPKDFILCEMGPGRGTLIRDIIVTILKLKNNFFNNCKIVLIETSKSLIKQQQELLKPYLQDLNIQWLSSIETIERKPIILIANEFLDALPIEQYIYKDNNLFLRTIILDENNKLIFKNLGDGTIIEQSPMQESLIKYIMQHLTKYGGGVLFIDYGELMPSYGDSLQAVKKHQYVDIFTNPGTSDLTSHVNFYNLAKIAQDSNCIAYGTTQEAFLKNLGICERKKKLKIHAVDRLIDSNQMGQLFKIVAFTPYSFPVFNFEISDKIL